MSTIIQDSDESADDSEDGSTDDSESPNEESDVDVVETRLPDDLSAFTALGRHVAYTPSKRLEEIMAILSPPTPDSPALLARCNGRVCDDELCLEFQLGAAELWAILQCDTRLTWISC